MPKQDTRLASKAWRDKQKAELEELRKYKAEHEPKELPPETTTAIVEKTKDLLKDKETGEDDPLIKLVEQIPKYMPLVQQILAGFRDSQIAKQLQQPQQTGPQRPIPPQGWLEMSPMERLKRKYSNPQWYQAGLNYEAQEDLLPATQYIDATYQEVATQRQEQISRQNFIQQPAPIQEPKSIPTIANETHYPKEQKEVKPQGEEIIMELNKDNAKYIGMATDYINKMTNEQIEEKLTNTEGLFAQLKAFKPFIPFQIKAMITSTTPQEFQQLIQTQCPEKYKYLQDKKLLDKVLEEFTKLQQELK
jgi:hypothetical protein